MGASQFALLFALGLRDRHRVLDFGCGSLRLGRLLIPFLQKGGYFGIDPNRWLIDDAFARELGWAIERVKQPKFAHNDDFELDVFSQSFDFVVAQSILTHCGPDLSAALIRRMADVVNPEGVVVFSVLEAAEDQADSTAQGWIYPGCVAFRQATVLAWCANAGLAARRLPWYHPGATWYVASPSARRLPTANQISDLHGNVLLEPGRPL